MDDPGEVMAYLLTASEAERAEWVQRQPLETNWWLALLVGVEHRRRDADVGLPAVVGLHLWLLRMALAMQVLTADDVASRTARLVADLHRTGLAGAVGEGMPSVDLATAQCLALLPPSPEELPDGHVILSRLASDTGDADALAAARASRRAKNLVDAAATNVAYLRNPELQAQLQRWIAALPRLL